LWHFPSSGYISFSETLIFHIEVYLCLVIPSQAARHATLLTAIRKCSGTTFKAALQLWRYAMRVRRGQVLSAVLLFCAALILAALPIAAQVLYGSIVGTVTDSSNNAVPQATVRITDTRTNQTRETQTNDLGGYSFPTLPAGSYDIAFTKPGYKTYSAKSLAVSVDKVVRIDPQLTVGQVMETVVVSGELPALQTDSAQVRSEVSQKSVENLPVPVNRNYQNLLIMVPGLSPPDNQHSVAVNPARGLTFSANGTTRNSNNVRIDGASSTNVWLPHVQGYIPALEAIQEVSVVTNSFDASEGLAGGAAVNVHIKSGTNSIHGSLFEYHTDNALKARPYNFNLSTVGVIPKPKYINNDFGGTIGGPILKDKLFYFVSYDGNPIRQNASPSSDLTVPNAAMRLGDFSASPNKIFDPRSGNQTNGTGRTQFVASSNPADPNYNPACTKAASCPNMIPVARLDAIALKLQGLMPLPTNPNATSNNFHAVGPYNFTRHTTDAKVDWHTTSKLTISERIGWLHYDFLDSPAYGSLVGPPVSSAGGKVGNGFGNIISNTISGNYVFRPNFLVDGYFGLTRLDTNQEPPRIGENLGQSFLGIPGTNGPSRAYGGWPQFTITNFTNSDFGNPGGGGTGGPIFYRDRQLQYSGNATWVKGTHSIRFGSELVQQNFNHFETTAAAGQFSFNGNATTLSGPSSNPDVKSANIFNSYAQFLLGLPSSIVHDLIPFDNNRLIAHSHNYGFYVQDTWQARRNVTLSYGLRWDHFPIGNRNGRGLERYDFATNLITLCGLGGTPRDCGYDVSFKEFSPRVGVAWRATNTFVVRAGFGINFDPQPLAWVRDLLNDYPENLELVLNSTNSFLPAALPNGSFATLAAGIPAIAVPDVSSGVVALPKNFAIQTLPQHVRRDYVEGWNLTLQKELLWGFNGQMGYVAARQVAVPQFFNLNAGQIGGGSASQPFFARNGNVGLNLITPVNHTHYDSLQTNLSRRFSKGYMVNVGYTFSKAIVICCDELADKNPAIQLPQFFNFNRALAPYDRTHLFTASGIIELPFGRGKKWLSESGVGSAVLGGWQLNTLVSAYSGKPFTVTSSSGPLNAPGALNVPGGSTLQLADRVKPQVKVLGGVGPNPYFDPFAFAPVTQARLGTAGLNTLRGPGSFTTDLSLFRNFQVSERWAVQVRAEAFNLTNTPHFSNPGTNVSNLQLNSDGTTIKSLGGYDQITSTTATGRDGIDERQFRFGVRISF
jgi:hypothetical protein